MSIVNPANIFYRVISLVGLYFLSLVNVHSQCDYDAGYVCNPDSVFGAPIICDIDCLDGFTATMPTDSIYGPQPEKLCDDGGKPDNMSWFAFVAGADSISLTITPFNCNEIFDMSGNLQYSAIQAGIMADCNMSDPDILVCYNECADPIDGKTPTAATLTSGDLVPGQTYYFYVDGCGGTVCDYTITVNFGSQPFAVNDPSGISSDAVTDGDTLCTGYVDVTFSLDGVEDNIEYNWFLSPPNADFPDTDLDGVGIYPSTDAKSITTEFLVAGNYQLFAYSNNDCDQSDTVYFNFTVAPLSDIVFDTVAICGEDFGQYTGPFQVIDGVPTGWMSGVINMPGWNTGTVVTNNGCSYNESVFVSRIPTPIEQVDVYVCEGLYPFDFAGITFNSIDDAGMYRVGSSVLGCDSMINVQLIEIEVFGQIGLSSCFGDSVSLVFTLDSMIGPADSVRYRWQDSSGIITDSNDDDNDINVAVTGQYQLFATIYNGQDQCDILVDDYFLDINDLKPNAAAFIDPILTVCADDSVTMYSVATDGTETEVNWYIANDPSIEIPATPNVSIDWRETNENELCVYTINDCGVSDTICIQIDVLLSPMIDFEVNDTVCINTPLEFIYTGDADVVMSWNTSGGSFNDLGSDMYTIEWASSGIYNVTIQGVLNSCGAETYQKQIIVIDPPTQPQVSCSTDTDGILFTWNLVDCADAYTLDTNGVVIYTGLDNSFLLTGLTEGQQVSANLVVNSSCYCGDLAPVSTSCEAVSCPDIDITIDGIGGFMCMSELSEAVNYTANIIGGNGMGVGTWSGQGIDEDGVFNAGDAVSGAYTFYYTYQQEDCVYQDSTLITILDNPELVLDVDNPDCYDEESGSLDLGASGGSGAYSFFINGNVTTDLSDIDLEAGSYDISVVDNQNCGDQEIIDIVIPNQPDLQILGNGDIIEGNTDIISINTSEFIGVLIDSILWSSSDGIFNCISNDCQEIMVSPDAPTSYFVTVYYNDGCNVEASYLLSVRPETKFAFPNVLSPNGNNSSNQRFTFGTNNPDLFIESFLVYNRWGELVYNQSDFSVVEEERFWDGRFNGQLVPPGVYVYVIKMNDDGKSIIRKGDITIMR